MRFRLACLTVAALASPAFAGDVYVDPVNGNDANIGTSPATAWKTITHASGATYSGGSLYTIHLAPGIYDASSGESFPFELHGQWLVGDQGRAATILQGGNRIFVSYYQQFAHVYSWSSEIRGVTLRGSIDAAIACTYILHLVDVTIENEGNAGIELGGSATNLPNDRNLNVSLVGVDIHGCPRALSTSAGAAGLPGANVVTMTDCRFTGQTQAGLSLAGSNTYTLSRCVVDANAGNGIELSGGPISLSDCLITRSGADGLHCTPTLDLSIVRTTIAENTNRGIFASADCCTALHATLQSSILYGNNGDYDVTLNGASSVSASYGDIGDGHFAGSNGNIAVDPMFVDAANGDFGLRFGSSCIDTGDPATPNGTLDLAGTARSIDGDLDTNERADIGAFEHATLALTTTGHIGSPLALEISGPSGGSTTVYFSRLAPVAPMSTPFGDFDLSPTVHGTLFSANLGANPPLVFHRPIPNNPLLVGRTFSFQALTSSSAAPQGFAYTNVVQATILP